MEDIEIEKSPEEQLQELIRSQSDYNEIRFNKNGYIDRIEESSIELGKMIITQFNYTEVIGGLAMKGTSLKIIEL